MLDVDALVKELSSLSSEAVAQIHDSLHDLKHPAVARACMEVLWTRHAVIICQWPTREAVFGDPNGGTRSGTHDLIKFCRSGSHPRDSYHYPVKMLDWSYKDDRGDRRFDDIRCSCGLELGTIYKTWQARPNALVWPTVFRDGIPHFQICRFARCADDPAHAPKSTGMTCLCGGYLGIHHPDDDTDKFLPAY